MDRLALAAGTCALCVGWSALLWAAQVALGRLPLDRWTAATAGVFGCAAFVTMAAAAEADRQAKDALLQKARAVRRLQTEVDRLERAAAMAAIGPAGGEQIVAIARPLLLGTECIFARNARIWGSLPFNPLLSLEENVRTNLPNLLAMLSTKESAQPGDGFLFALPTDPYGNDLDAFASTVKRIFTVISDHDPCESDFINKPYIDKRGWQILFNNEDLFVTTFAPFYDEKSSRYQHGIADYCFVLLQPGYSFVSHAIGEDTPGSVTQWDNPKSVRDRIRANYRNNGRQYMIPEVVDYPQAEHIVKNLAWDGPPVKWWDVKE